MEDTYQRREGCFEKSGSFSVYMLYLLHEYNRLAAVMRMINALNLVFRKCCSGLFAKSVHTALWWIRGGGGG